MSIRAKMKIESIELYGDGGGRVRMTPVISGSPENESFFKWTPSGMLELGTVNKAVMDQLELGAEMYIDISPAG
jgi:hypothetical protein